jgi:hypothetical protein
MKQDGTFRYTWHADTRTTIWAAMRAVLCMLAGYAIAFIPLVEAPVGGLAMIIAPFFAGLFAGASRWSPVLLGAFCCALASALVILVTSAFTAGEELGGGAGGAGFAIVAYSAIAGAIGAKIASRTPPDGAPNDDANREKTD